MTESKMIIEIEPENIQVTSIRNGVRSTKNTDLASIQEVLNRDHSIETPLLPSQWGVQKYIRNSDREMYVLTTPPHVREVRFVNVKTPYKVPMPGFCWIIIARIQPGTQERVYVHGMSYAIKNQILSEKDRLFRFPFANVDSRWMCWGDQPAPMLGSSKSIMMVPDHFLGMNFNTHLDDNKFNYFDAEIEGQKITLSRTSHLFRYFNDLVKKAEAEGQPADSVKFKYDILIQDKTLGEAIADFRREFLR